MHILRPLGPPPRGHLLGGGGGGYNSFFFSMKIRAGLLCEWGGAFIRGGVCYFAPQRFVKRLRKTKEGYPKIYAKPICHLAPQKWALRIAFAWGLLTGWGFMPMAVPEPQHRFINHLRDLQGGFESGWIPPR